MTDDSQPNDEFQTGGRQEEMMMANIRVAASKQPDASKIIIHGAGGPSEKRSCPGHFGITRDGRFYSCTMEKNRAGKK